MDKKTLSPEWFARVAEVDTPTICNALELASGRRQAIGFTYGTPIATPKPLPAIVGYARTMRFRAAEPSTLGAEENRSLRLNYYRYVTPETGEPVVLVMQDIDHLPGIGSNWGEVNSTIHKALGVKGVLTNGSVRDIDMLAPDFPIVAGSIGVSHAHAHVVDFDTPVTVFGMDVNPGDIVHVDRHGGAIIPFELASDLPHFIDLTFKKEAPLLEAARKPGFSIEHIEQALKESSDIH